MAEKFGGNILLKLYFRDSDTRQPWCATAVDSDG